MANETSSTSIYDPDGDKKDQVLRWVTFQLDKEIYGVNVMQVREVLRYSDIAPVPGAPAYVLGIINLRGNVVSVIDTRIMIIESERQVVGILVDSVAEVVDLNTKDIDDTPNVGTEESAKFICGVCNRSDDLLILIDLYKLLSEEEWQDIANLSN